MDINELAAKLLTRLNKDEVDQALKNGGYTDNRIEAAVFIDLVKDKAAERMRYPRQARYQVTYFNEDTGRYENGNVFVRWNPDRKWFVAEF